MWSYLTSAAQQLKESDDFKRNRTLQLCGNLFLSASGYKALGYTWAEIDDAFAVAAGDRKQHLTFLEFSKGMRAYAQNLNDPRPEQWQKEHRNQQIDAMILLADTDEAFMLRQVGTVLSRLQEVADVVARERGHVTCTTVAVS